MRIILFISLIVSLMVVGCTKSAPKCNDKETKDLVLQLAWENILPDAYKWKTQGITEDEKRNAQIAFGDKAEGIFERAKAAELSIENVTTLGKAENGTYQCQCELVLTNPIDKITRKAIISYDSGATDDGKHIVQAFGLDRNTFNRLSS